MTTANGQRQMIIVETNSCPSGQKSMPLLSDLGDEYGGYGVVIDSTFKRLIASTNPSHGDLAVIYDKNHMEASGYAAVMAEYTAEKVWLVECYLDDKNPPVKWIDGLMFVRDSGNGTLQFIQIGTPSADVSGTSPRNHGAASQSTLKQSFSTRWYAVSLADATK